MELWLKISLLLCLVGYFKGMVPSDHFMFQYMTDFREVPSETLTSFFYPQLWYWTAGLSIFFLLITDMLRYKPVLILGILAGISYYATMRWTLGKNALIVSEHLNTFSDLQYFKGQ